MFDTPHERKILLIGFSLLNTLCFSGIIFGWAPLSVMLEDEGQYSEDCDVSGRGVAPGDGVKCPEQAAKFTAIFATATFLVNGISLPSGQFLDSCGGRAMSATALVFTVAGLMLMGVSDSAEFDWFLPGYGLLAVGGQMTLFAVFPTAFEISEYQTLVFAANSCLFDGSCVVFQALSSMHEAFGFSRKRLFFGYAAFSIPLYLINVFLWRFSSQQEQQDSAPVAASAAATTTHQAARAQMNSSPRFSPRFTSPVRPTATPPPHSNGNGNKTSSPLPAKSTESSLLVKTTTVTTREVKDLGLFDQLKTPEFAFILVFASIGILRANLYISSNEQLLMNLGDNQPPNNRLYSHLFGYLLPLGFLFIPAIDRSVALGMGTALHATNTLAIAVGLLMLVPSLNVQVVNFLVFAAFRAFLYGVMGAYIGSTFGPLTLGRVTGCVFTAGSVANLAQAPLVNATNLYFEGSTDTLALCVVALGLAMVLPIALNERRQRRQTDEEDGAAAAHHQRQGKVQGGGYVEVQVVETPLV